MDLLQFLENKTFTEVKDILTKDPYNIIVKELDNLYMLVYDNNKSDFSYNFVRNCRGIILEKETNKIICYTFNKKNNINIENADRIYESIDGTHIKLYYYNGEWMKSTTRCINAYKAYWHTSKSFGDLFDECDNGQIDYDSLNKNYCYGFVICHTENRIVTPYTENKFVHVCTRDMSEKNFPFISVNIGIDIPIELSKEGILEFEKNNKYSEGIIVWSNENHNKIKFKSYNSIKNLRTNTNNLLFEYVTNLCNGNRSIYVSEYSENKELYSNYENMINYIVNKIHRSYMDYHVNKVKILGQINKMYWKHMYNLHGEYKNNNKIITKDVVRDYIISLDPPQVMYMLNKCNKNIIVT